MIFLSASGHNYELSDKPVASGGEGTIHEIKRDRSLLAKVYHSENRSSVLESKIAYMVKRQPAATVMSSIAWPRDTLYKNGEFVGFTMDRLNVGEELGELYKYPPRGKVATIEQRIMIAQNICAVINEVHKAGYVFGDFNPANIGVDTETGLVTFLDTDTYQFIDDSTGHSYRCSACLAGYVAPEVIKACKGKNFLDVEQPPFSKNSDNFALAIHIFKLLMNGVNPYTGINEDTRKSQASPAVGNDAIERDQYCFKPGKKPTITFLPPLSALPDEICELFTLAFIEGRVEPNKRPDAIRWHRALVNYRSQLTRCPKNNSHQYRKQLRSCPWCEADERYSLTLSPTLAQVSTGRIGPGQIIGGSSSVQPGNQMSQMQERALKLAEEIRDLKTKLSNLAQQKDRQIKALGIEKTSKLDPDNLMEVSGGFGCLWFMAAFFVVGMIGSLIWQIYIVRSLPYSLIDVLAAFGSNEPPMDIIRIIYGIALFIFLYPFIFSLIEKIRYGAKRKAKKRIQTEYDNNRRKLETQLAKNEDELDKLRIVLGQS